MIDISKLKDYIQEIIPFHIKMLEHDVQNFGREEVYSMCLKHLDCTHIADDGVRLRQTIGLPYMQDISIILYVIQTYFEGDEDNRLQEVIDVHERNLAYEIENPPVWYGGEKAKQKFEKEFGSKKTPKIKKATNVERKLATKIGKINALKINLKPANNG